MMGAVAIQRKGEASFSCGSPFLGREILIDENNLIQVKGPGQFLYYLDENAQRVDPHLKNGHFSTQDLGQWDGEGRLQMMGRADDVFQCAGEKISPHMIEQELCKIPGVFQAVVVPQEDAEYGHLPWAFIAAHPMRESSFYQEQLGKRLSGLFMPRVIRPLPEHLICLPEAGQGPLKCSRALVREYAQRQMSTGDDSN